MPFGITVVGLADDHSSMPCITTLAAIDARPFWRDKTIFPSGAGYHYNHNPLCQLFNQKSDPKKKHDIASNHPNVVQRMAAQHTAWSKTLAPLGVIPKIRTREPIIPGGRGWASASGKGKGDGE